MEYANMYSKRLIVDKLMTLKDTGNKQINNILQKAQLDRNFYIRNSLK